MYFNGFDPSLKFQLIIQVREMYYAIIIIITIIHYWVGWKKWQQWLISNSSSQIQTRLGKVQTIDPQKSLHILSLIMGMPK